MRKVTIPLAALILALGLSGCLTKRTVSEDGDVISQKYFIKTPFSKDP